MVPIPREKLPEFFLDETRKNVLYAPLRSKTVNPIDWDFKITSWKQLINLYCSLNKVYSFSLESLKVAFQDNGRTPKCLDEVLANMLMNKEIETFVIFSEKKPKTWAEWAKKSLISSPITWSFNKMKNFVISPDLNKIEYVPLTVVHSDSDVIHKELLINHKNEILSLDEILREKNLDTTKQKDFEILFVDLYNLNKVDMLEISVNSSKLENMLIKICDPNHYEAISDTDLSIRTLKANQKALEKNIEFLTDSVNKCNEEAKAYLVKGQKQLAKASLKKKHEIENRINKKAETLYNIHILLNKLLDMTLTGEVVDSYKKALEAFEGTLKKGVNIDSIDDTMAKVAEMLEIQSDMENALGKSVLDDGDEDLEKELDDLLDEDESTNNNKGSPNKDSDESLLKALEDLDLKLPSVPSSPVNDNKSSQDLSTQIS